MTDDEVRSAAADAEEQQDAARTEPTSRTGLFANKGFVGALAFAVVAFLAAVTFAALYWTAAAADQYRVAEARDQTVDVAERGIRAYTAVDYRDLDGYRGRQREISTDDLFDANAQSWERKRNSIRDNQLLTTVEILDIGVMELNEAEGDAVVVASTKNQVSSKGKKPQTQYMPWLITLKKVGDDWRMSELPSFPPYVFALAGTE